MKNQFKNFVKDHKISFNFEFTAPDPNAEKVAQHLTPLYRRAKLSHFINKHCPWSGKDVEDVFQALFSWSDEQVLEYGIVDTISNFIMKCRTEFFHHKVHFNEMFDQLPIREPVIVEDYSEFIKQVRAKFLEHYDAHCIVSFAVTVTLFMNNYVTDTEAYFAKCMKMNYADLLNVQSKVAKKKFEEIDSIRESCRRISNLQEYHEHETVSLQESFSNYIKSCINVYHAPQVTGAPIFPFPYVTLCQSSGYGKTALVYQMRFDFYVIYICLRPAEFGAEPPRSYFIADLLEQKTIQEEDRSNFYAAIIYQMIKCAKELITMEKGGIQSSSDFFEENFLNQRRFYKKFKSYYESNTFPRSFQEKDIVLKRAAQDFAQYAKKPLLFVFDEVKALLSSDEVVQPRKINNISYFQKLRKVLSYCSPNCFSVFIDKSLEISNCAPDPNVWHSKLLEVQGYQDLFPPFTELTTIGVLPVNETKIEQFYEVIEMRSIKFRFNRFHVLTFNRPLYTAMLHHELEVSSIYDTTESLWLKLRRFAILKLISALDHPSAEFKTLSPLEQLIPLAIKFGTIPMNSIDQQTLVANHMATLQTQSLVRSVILTKYVLEPFHGEAASAILFDNFTTALENLYRFKVNGNLEILTDTQNIGKLLASMILSRAFDKTVHELQEDLTTPTEWSTYYYARPIPVEAFLSKFTSHEKGIETIITKPSSSLEIKGRLQLVCFLQFVVVYRPITLEILKKAYERRAALVCKSDQEDINICIPIALPPQANEVTEKLSPNSAESLENYEFSAIFIQVKNWHSSIASRFTIDTWFSQIDSLAHEILRRASSHYSFVMAVGTAQLQSYEVPAETPHRRFLQGIDTSTYQFLSQEECALLMSLSLPNNVPQHSFMKIEALYEQNVQNVLELTDPMSAPLYLSNPMTSASALKAVPHLAAMIEQSEREKNYKGLGK